MTCAAPKQTDTPSITDEVWELLEEGYQRHKAYLRTRRRIVWDRELTTQERQELLRALKAAYHGDNQTCCEDCPPLSHEAVVRLPEPARLTRWPQPGAFARAHFLAAKKRRL